MKENVGSSVATNLWERKCFTLELYHINGQVRTKAEAIQQWLHDGYSFDQCLDYFSRENFRQCQPPENFRQVDSAWKTETRLRLFRQAADHLRKFREGARECQDDAGVKTKALCRKTKAPRKQRR